MTEDSTLTDEPTLDFWWKQGEGPALIERTWTLLEDCWRAGAEVTVRISAPGTPRVTIGFDHDVLDEDADA